MTIRQNHAVDSTQNVGVVPKVFSDDPSVESPKGSARTLHEIFPDEMLATKTQGKSELLSESEGEETESPSFWKKFIAPWFASPEMQSQPVDQITGELASSSKVGKIEPISFAPTLEVPEAVSDLNLSPTDLPQTSIDEKAVNKNDRLTLREFEEAVSLMSEKTMEQIFAIILKAQLELERENAEATEGTINKFHDIKKLNDKMLDEIKEALLKDTQVVSKLSTVHKIMLAASLICGAVAGASTFGLVPDRFHQLATALGFYGSIATGVATGIAKGSKAYYESRIDGEEAQRTKFKHFDKHYEKQLQESREHLFDISKANDFFKERLIKAARRIIKMGRQK